MIETESKLFEKTHCRKIGAHCLEIPRQNTAIDTTRSEFVTEGVFLVIPERNQTINCILVSGLQDRIVLGAAANTVSFTHRRIEETSGIGKAARTNASECVDDSAVKVDREK